MPDPKRIDWKEAVRERLRDSALTPTRETEIIEEVSQHLSDRYYELVTNGTPEPAAHAQVMRELGSHQLLLELKRIEQPATEPLALGSDSGGNFVSGILYDLRYAWRLLRLNPSFTAVAVISLALGIGANTAIFELLNAVRLRSLPVKDPQQLALVKLDSHNKGRTGEFRGNGSQNTYAQFQLIRERNQAFSNVAAWGTGTFDLASGGEVHYARGLYVSGDFFNVLGVGPLVGRILNSSDDVSGCGSPGIVISYPFWRREFAQDANIVGRKLTLDGHPFSVIGVTPPNFFGIEVGRQFDVALPMCSEAIMRPEKSSLTHLDHWWLTVIGRLKPGWTIEKASAQLAAISPAIFKETLPANYTAKSREGYLGFTLTAVPGSTGTSYLRRVYADPLSLLLAITALVLLIACANLANLMLARASAREREIAIRLALGAARRRLIRQLLTESLLIALIGAAAGLLIAHNVSKLLLGFLSTQDSPLFVDLSLDWRMFLFTAGMAAITCVLFGLAPALRATTTAPSRAMNASGRSVTSTRERSGLRRILVVTQVALSLVLVISAMLFVRSLNHLMQMEAGLRREGIQIAYVDFSRLKIPPEQRRAYKEQILQSIRALPGVTSAAQTNIVPISGSGWNENIIVDEKLMDDADFMRVSPQFFKTVETPLLLGRDFDSRDSATATNVAVVNQLFAEKMLKTDNPLGKIFTIKSYEDKVESFQVVGMVKNAKYNDLRDDFRPLVYVPDAQDKQPDPFPGYLIRSDLPPDTIMAEVKDALSKTSPVISLDFRVFRTQIMESLARERMLAMLSGFFGVLAGVLAVVGIYGVISYMVVRRTNEIGVRMALGATRGNILTLILREAGILLAIGIVIGTGLTFAAARMVSSLLYGLKPTDIATYALAICSLATVTIAASLLPAQRASRLDPMAALRDE